MGAEVYNLNAKMTVDVSNFQKGIKEAENSTKNFSSNIRSLTSKVSTGAKNWGLDLNKFYDKGSGIFKKFGIDVDKFASHFGMSGKMMTAIVACVTALVKLGQEMDEAMAEIVKGTGAMGDALDDLNYTAQEALVQGVGTSVKEAGKLIADLNTEFGMTGETLEKTAVEFGHFAKATGVDVGNAVSNIADVMDRWNVPMEKSKDLMNQLTKASQVSGVSVDELVSGVNSGSVYFEQFGFNLTESIAMLSSFGKSGIEASTVITGMRTALAKFASEGKNAKEAFAETSSQIKEATTDTEALQIAVNTFGQRSAPEMVKAIRSGSTSFEELTGELRKAGNALDDTYESVRTSKDAMTDLKNALKGTFGGLGQAFSALWKGILDGLTELVRFIEPVIHPIVENFRVMWTKLSELLSWFIRELRKFIEEHNVVWNTLIIVLNTVKDAFQKIFGDLVGIVKDAFGIIFSLFGGRWEEAWIHAQLVFFRFGRIIANICNAVANVFVKLANFITQKIMGKFGNFFKGLYKKLIDFAHWTHNIIDPTGLGKATEGLSDAEIDKVLDEAIGGLASGKMGLKEVDLAESWGLNDKIEELESRLKELKGASDDLSDLGEIGKYSGWSGTLPGIGAGGSGDKEAQESTAWLQKRLQQQLDAIEKEKKEKLNALAEEGAAQDELDAVNSTYAQKQIEIYGKIQELKKAGDLKALENVKNAEEEKLQLEEYYAKESEDYRVSVETNTVKAIEKIEEESTEWKQKLLDQEISQIEDARNKSIDLAKEEGRSIEDIQAMQRESINKQIAKYLELMQIRREADLEEAKGEEEKSNVEKYYANETTAYINNLWGTMLEETSGQTEKWYKKFQKVMEKIGSVVKKVVDTAVKVVRKGFDIAWKIIQFDPDEFLDSLLKVADTIETFFIETVPRLPGIVDSVGNCIEVIADTIGKPEVIDTLMQAIEGVVIKSVEWMTKNVRKILGILGKLIGAIIKALGKVIAQIDWIKLVGEILAGLWDAIASIGQGLWDGIVSIFTKIGDWIRNWWSNLWGSVGNWWNNMWSGVGNWFKGLFGFATGTNNAPRGLALVGEQGPELIDLHGGERIYNANSTRDILSGGSSENSNVWNVTFNNTVDTTAYTMMRQLKGYQRQMAVNGII